VRPRIESGAGSERRWESRGCGFPGEARPGTREAPGLISPRDRPIVVACTTTIRAMTSKTEAPGLLQALGFSEYEARAYVALLGETDLNGYEVAKASGMPRANVYPVLERLVSRRAARRIETRAGRRYAAIPPEE